MTLQEAASKTIENVDIVKESVQKYSTILGCLIEFNAMQ